VSTEDHQPIELDPTIRPTVSVDEAAIVLGVSRGTAYDAVERGELPSIRVGRRIRVPTASLARLVGLDA
jgi:excisionase family DNA binding protein